MTPDHHAGAPSRLVATPMSFVEAYDDQLERHARLEERQAQWLVDFHNRFGGAPR
jgi:hypothetical protein